MRNEIELQARTQRLELEIERQKAIMRVAALHAVQQEKPGENSSIRHLLLRLRSQPSIDVTAELEAI